MKLREEKITNSLICDNQIQKDYQKKRRDNRTFGRKYFFVSIVFMIINIVCSILIPKYANYSQLVLIEGLFLIMLFFQIKEAKNTKK